MENDRNSEKARSISVSPLLQNDGRLANIDRSDIHDSHINPQWPPEGFAPALIILLVFMIYVNFFGSLFLLLARFMRDEYAEGLCRRSLNVMGYFGAVVPPIFLVCAWIIYFLYLQFVHPTAPLDGSVYLDAPEYIDWLFEPGVSPLVVIMTIWGIFLQSYVVIFQFLRWRDK